MIWLWAGLALLVAGAVAVVWAVRSLARRLNRIEIMEHYLDDY